MNQSTLWTTYILPFATCLIPSCALIYSLFYLSQPVPEINALPTVSIMLFPLFQSWRAALWGFGQLFPFSEFFDNPGQSLIRSAKDLLSWFRIGRYLQCPPRKEPLNTRYTTLSTRPSCSQLQTFRQGSRVPQNPSFSSRRWCQLRWETSWSNP